MTQFPSDLLCEVRHIGPLPRVNRKYSPAYSHKKRKSYMRLTTEWNEKFPAMVYSFSTSRTMNRIIDEIVDLVIIIHIRNVTDSDAAIKGIFDAMEEARILKNDRLIRPFLVKPVEEFQKDFGEFASVGIFRHSPAFPFTQNIIDYLYEGERIVAENETNQHYLSSPPT